MNEEWKCVSLTRANAISEAITKSVRNLHGIQGVALCKAGLFGMVACKNLRFYLNTPVTNSLLKLNFKI